MAAGFGLPASGRARAIAARSLAPRRLAIGLAAIVLGGLAVPGLSFAQTSEAMPKPRPTGRVSLFADAWTADPDGAAQRSFRELVSTVTFHAAETDEDGLDYGLDLRYAGVNGGTRPARTSIYEAFVGARLGDGTLRVRGGHLWLNDLGGLGSLAGGQVEIRQQATERRAIGRWRAGAFGGLEPKVFEAGYYDDVKKVGVYGALDGADARRHVLGYVNVRDGSLTERSVVTTTNYVPVRRAFFLYQAAEYDVARPAGQAQPGLTYFYANARANPTDRLELQGTYHRGRSIDTRGLADDVINARPISPTAVQGLAYQSVGGRVTVQPVRRVRVYGGYWQDKSNREDVPAGRMMLGGYAPNIAGSGFDLSASETRVHRSSTSYHSEYVSVGHSIGRQAYVSGDYTTSLSVIRFARGSDGLIIEDRPTTRRLSGTASVNVGPTTSLQITVDQTWDTGVRELSILSGVSYRFR